jgi:hypothetical protein
MARKAGEEKPKTSGYEREEATPAASDEQEALLLN